MASLDQLFNSPTKLHYEDEYLSHRHVEYPPNTFRGVVGWKSTAGNTFFSNVTGEKTLVMVTLHEGIDQHLKDTSPGKAYGKEVLCHVLGPFYYIPPVGTPVLVTFHKGISSIGGTILGTTLPSPTIQFNDTKAKLDLGPEVDLVIKAKSVTITDYQNNYIACTGDNSATNQPSGVVMSCKDGSGVFASNSHTDPTGVSIWCSDSSGNGACLIGMTENGLKVNVKTAAGQSHLDMSDGNFFVFAEQKTWLNGGTNLLGPAPAAGFFAHYGPNPTTALLSTTVFISA